MLTPNRIVAVLTPLFSALAAGICTWVAKHVPGVQLSQEDLTSVFIAGALVALAPALQWLHGWQKWEARHDEAEQLIETAAVGAIAEAPAAEDGDEPYDFDESAYEELDELEAFADEDDEEEDPLLAGRPAAAAAEG